ncbi:hypothetical protein [Tumebacillus sp. BK434]|uniref:hypothetical protein n=1 Tax=Tumebacillus sp. BK434 TaxID=2512169 RepID=UPI001404ED92|nr:hypothetical protein [Tumebacillus sp. BK434]
MKHQIEKLPEKVDMPKLEKSHPLVGRKITDFLALPEDRREGYRVFLFVSPDCPSCFKGIEDLLEMDLDVPRHVSCFLLADEGEDTSKFFTFYQELMPISIIPTKFAKQEMKIEVVPSFVVIDDADSVLEVTIVPLAVRKYFSVSLKGGESNDEVGFEVLRG